MSVARSDAELIWAFSKWGFDDRGWRPGTRETYCYRVRQANDWLRRRGKTIRSATVADLKDFLASMPPDPRTRNNYRAALLGFGDFLVDRGMASHNPAASIRRLRVSEKAISALSESDAAAVETLAGALFPKKKVVVLLLLYGGVRREEARTLEWRNVDLASKLMTVTGKGGKDRTIPLARPLWEALREWRPICEDAQWVLPSPQSRSRPVSVAWIRKVLKEIGDSLGIERLHSHKLRHTCATTLLDTGAHVRDVQEWLGHTSIQTTGRYLTARPRRLQEAAERLTFRPKRTGSKRKKPDVSTLQLLES